MGNSIDWNTMIKRIIVVCIGVILLSFGAAIMKEGGVGVDPYTAMNIGIADTFGWSLGNYQLISNIVILILMFVFDRKLIGVGTLINMIFVGYLIDFFSAIWQGVNLPTGGIVIGIIVLLIGIPVFDFGVALYIKPGLGTSPYDSLTPMVIKYGHWPYRVIRIIQDVTVVIIAFLFGGPVGIGTVVTAFLNGPLIDFFSNFTCKHIMNTFVYTKEGGPKCT